VTLYSKFTKALTFESFYLPETAATMARTLAPEIENGGGLGGSIFASPTLISQDKGAQILMALLIASQHTRPPSASASADESGAGSICRALAAAAAAAATSAEHAAGGSGISGGAEFVGGAGLVRGAQMALVCLLWHSLFFSYFFRWYVCCGIL
jgi:hypothetical protein